MSILLIQNLMTTALAVRYSIIAMAGMAIDDVRYATMMMLFINSNLKYHLLMANMILMLIFLGGNKHPNDIPQTWIALKRVMRVDLFLHTMHVI
jgi:hypothetical protein